MIDPDQIPDEVVEAAACLLCRERHPCWSIVEEVMELDIDGQGTEFRIAARVAIAAAINAWPESHWVGDFGLHLPVPSEGNEQKRLGPEFEAAIFSDVDSLYEADKSEGEA